MPTAMKQTLIPFLMLLAAAPLLAQKKGDVDFEKQILPILQKQCVECHKEAYVDENGRRRRPKGKVMLDTLANIQKSKRGKLFVAKKPDDSLVMESILLPADDEDRMPPQKKGPPLPKADIELIRKWIEQGANYGKWTGEEKSDKKDDKSKGKDKKESDAKKKAPSKKKGPSPLVTLRKGLQPVAAATLAQFVDSPFTVASVGDENPLLAVTCAGNTDEVDDAALRALLAVKEHVTDLDLSRSQIGDGACEVIAQMPRLTHLDLRQTAVSDTGVAKLAACEELRSLNLFATKVGDYAMNGLARLPNLENLYVWQTDVSAKAVVRLREQRPGLRVVFSADLPEKGEDVAAGNRRRR